MGTKCHICVKHKARSNPVACMVRYRSPKMAHFAPLKSPGSQPGETGLGPEDVSYHISLVPNPMQLKLRQYLHTILSRLCKRFLGLDRPVDGANEALQVPGPFLVGVPDIPFFSICPALRFTVNCYGLPTPCYSPKRAVNGVPAGCNSRRENLNSDR